MKLHEKITRDVDTERLLAIREAIIRSIFRLEMEADKILIDTGEYTPPEDADLLREAIRIIDQL